jgi:trans-aconitate methyltransferase
LLDAGWRVVAVDSAPSTPARLAQQIGACERLEVRVQAFKDLRLEGVDLVHAAYALPFTDPTDFPSVWQGLRDALSPGGWLAVDLFGDRDDWAHTEGMTFLTRSRLGELLQGLDVVLLDEEDEDGRAFTGPKHWHVFHVLARQPEALSPVRGLSTV